MAHDAWNPGLTSDIPTHLLPRITLFQPGNSHVDYQAAKDAADICGLEPRALVSLTVERLIVHELLIRVTGGLTVADGPSYDTLGINLRSMVARIYGHIEQDLEAIKAQFARFEAHAKKDLQDALVPAFEPPAPPPKRGLIARLLRAPQDASPPDLVLDALEEWSRNQTPITRALQDIVGGIVATRGRLIADRDLIVDLAARLLRNSEGSREIGRLITPLFEEAIKAEGYRKLPAQADPVVMNVKGASAAGKSTIRSAQRELAEKLGTPWEDFALVSPDYWRKYLFDYESLGADYKYGAMLTGHELEMIDRKLDAYMAAKHASGTMPHLLIDRFRFDSFVSEQDSNLLSRFGARVFLFFMVTPPAETVTRAWTRGLETGRYKAVDDLLYHNIEAYEGMPRLFFSWMATQDRDIHFEFLDNDVPLGARPRTIAYGTPDQMVVLDVRKMCDVSRYRHVNIEADQAEDVLEAAQEPAVDFLGQCVATIPDVLFGEQGTVVAHAQSGRWLFRDDGLTELDALGLEPKTDGLRPSLPISKHLLGA